MRIIGTLAAYRHNLWAGHLPWPAYGNVKV
jgi:hypothetical protein